VLDATVSAVDDTDHTPAVRFVVVGAAHPHAIVLTAGLLDAGAECAGWVDTPGEHDGSFAAIFPGIPALGLDDALGANADLVVIAAVPNLRAAYAVAAMRAGADVLVAKPGATDAEQLAAIEAAGNSTGRRWWVAFTEHFTSRAIVRAYGLVEEGRVGTVRHVLGLGPHRRGASRPAWFSSPAESGGMLADLASHQIHHAARLLGTTDLQVVAARTTPSPDGSHPELIGELMLEGGTGSAYTRVDWLTPEGLETWGDVRLMITGDNGTIEVRSNCDPAGEPGGDHLIVVDAAGTERMDCRNDDLGWAGQIIADVRHGTEHLITTEHALAVTGLALDAAAIAAG